MTSRSGALLLCLTLAGCATSNPTRSATSSDVISRADIEASSAANAYELVQELRPQFLRRRGQTSMRDPGSGYPVVYINDVRHGSLDVLYTIRLEEIDEIRYIGSSDATTRWGTGHTGGVIQVRANY
jgi:outer membrane cobalamin receptor